MRDEICIDVVILRPLGVICFFCRDLVDEAKNYLLLPQERPLMQGPRTRPRKPIRCGEVLFAGRCIIINKSDIFNA